MDGMAEPHVHTLTDKKAYRETDRQTKKGTAIALRTGKWSTIGSNGDKTGPKLGRSFWKNNVQVSSCKI